MKKFIKKPIVLIVAAVILIAAGYFYFSRSKNPAYEFSVAQKGEIIQTVSVTGHVKAAEAVDLAFEKTGRVSHIYVSVGDQASAGQSLVSLDNADLAAQLSQAQASVRTAQAQLDESEAELNKAQQDLANDYDSVSDILHDAYNKADDAVRNQVDQLFSNDEQINPQLTFSTSNSQAKIDVEFQRAVLTQELNKWRTELSLIDINSSTSTLEQGLANAQTRLTLVRNFLDRVMDTVIGAIALSQTTIDTYKVNINTSRTNINTALTNVNQEQQAIALQKLTVEKTQPEQIATQTAQVEQAQASVLNYQAQLDKTILRSPINGTVTKQETKVGEIVAANDAIVSIISNAKFEIEADIPEADIAKVKVNNSANVTLDAYGEDVIFEAKMIQIEPAETIIEGVATYKTTFEFTKEDERIKSGMTANIDILTDKRENTISIPRRAIISQDGDKIVRILVGDKVSEVKVKTGLIGSNGDIEIIDGVKEGDKVITSQ